MTVASTPPPAPWGPPLAGVKPGRSSPAKLLLFFVLALAVVVVVVGAIALAVAPPQATANCPDPRVPCVPSRPSLQPNATTAGAQATPRPTVRPGAPAGGGTGLVVPAPRAASNAAKLVRGTAWASSAHKFTLAYDDGIWSVGDEGPSGIFLTAARGNVAVTVVANPAGEVSPRDAVQREVDRLEGVVLGLTEEPDAARQLPGTPIIGFEPGVGGVYAGTINTPQGPGANVVVAVLAASDGEITLLVTVIATETLREPAFSAADSILNTVRWPGRSE